MYIKYFIGNTFICFLIMCYDYKQNLSNIEKSPFKGIALPEITTF